MSNAPDIFFQRLSRRVVILLAVIMFPALLASGLRAINADGAYGVVMFQAALYVWILYLALPMSRTSFSVRIYSLVGIGVAIGLGALIRNPDPSAGMAFLIVASVFLAAINTGPARYIFIAAIFPAAAVISHFVWQLSWQVVISHALSLAGVAAVANMLVGGVVAQARERARQELDLRRERDEALVELAREQARRDLVGSAADIAYLEYDYAAGRLDGDHALKRRYGRDLDDGAIDLASRFDSFPADSLATIQHYIAELSQQPVGIEQSFVHQQYIGETRELRTFRVTGLNIERDGRLFFMGASIDVTTEHKAVEDASRFAAQLDLMAKAGGIGMHTYYPATDMIKFNTFSADAADRFDISVKEELVPAAGVRRHLSPESLEKRYELNEELAKSPLGQVQHFEEHLVGVNGKEMRLRVARMRQREGAEDVYLSLSIDVTAEVEALQRAELQTEQLRKANEEIRFRAEYLENMLEAAPIPVCLLEGDSKSRNFTFVNKETLRVFGYTKEEMLGQNATEMMFLNDEDRQYYMSKVLESMKSGIPLREEMQLYRKNKVVGNFEFNCTYKMVGERLYGTLFVLDIDERKQKEHQLERAVRKSEQVASKLEQQQDRQAQMYAVIGHELRTPAASLQMMLDDLGEGESLDSALAHANIEQLLSVIDTLRAVAQPERMAQSAYDDVQLDEMLQQQAQNFQALAARQGVELNTDLTGLTIHPVHIQKTLLRQVLSNLIKNALIHSGGTQVEVGASGRLLEGHRKALRLWIADNGKGVSADKVERLFEAFVRGSTEAEGTGLGLHICREIIQNMGGDLRYELRPEGGACFVIELEVGLAKTNPAQPLKPQADESPLRGMRVLVAEDNKTIQMLTQRMLEKQGAQVTVCSTGQEALDAFEPSAFDLVLSDIFMPEMNGYELAREIRRVDTNVPLIGLTAATIGKETDEMLAAGATAVLSKPINLTKLTDVLSEVESSELSG